MLRHRVRRELDGNDWAQTTCFRPKLLSFGTKPRTLTVIENRGGARGQAVALSPDGQTVAAANENGLVRLWDRRVTPPRERARIATSGVALAFLSGGKTLATGSTYEGVIRLWDVQGPRPKQIAELS